MRDSVTYMAIIDEGREEEVKRLIRLVGEKKFGSPSESVLAQITGLADLERLERIMLHVFDVRNWQELLEAP